MFYRRKMGKLLGSFSAFGVLAWQMADGFRKGCVFSIKYKYRYKHILCFTHHKTVYFVSLFLFFSFVFWVQYVLASRGGYGCPVCVRISLCCVSGSCTFHCAVLFFFSILERVGTGGERAGHLGGFCMSYVCWLLQQWQPRPRSSPLLLLEHRPSRELQFKPWDSNDFFVQSCHTTLIVVTLSLL